MLISYFNARPGTPTYDRARSAGFDDAWARARPTGCGAHLLHRLPLDDPADQLRSRIDHIFTRGDLEVSRHRHGWRRARRLRRRALAVLGARRWSTTLREA